MLASLVATTTMLSVFQDVLALAGTTYGAETTLSATLAAIEVITSVELHTFVFAAGGTLLALGVYPASLWFWQLLALAFHTLESRLALLPTLAAIHRVTVQVHTRFVFAAGGTFLALFVYPASLWFWELLALAFNTSETRLALLPTPAAMHRIAVQVHTCYAAAGFLKMVTPALRGPRAPITVGFRLLFLLHQEPTLTP